MFFFFFILVAFRVCQLHFYPFHFIYFFFTHSFLCDKRRGKTHSRAITYGCGSAHYCWSTPSKRAQFHRLFYTIYQRISCKCCYKKYPLRLHFHLLASIFVLLFFCIRTFPCVFLFLIGALIFSLLRFYQWLFIVLIHYCASLSSRSSTLSFISFYFF